MTAAQPGPDASDRLVSAAVNIPRVLTVKEVAVLSRRGHNRVRDAANTGALVCVDRKPGGRMLFLEADVADWIRRGSPEFPSHTRR